jgi:acetate kinase
MNDLVLVLNAGSSSLKFGVYRAGAGAALQLVARGQIEGIGTAPRMSAHNDSGAALPTSQPEAAIRDMRGALAHLANWLRGTFQGAKVVGVGHRVVHGGPRHAGPVIVTAAVLDELRELVPLAPLHQPHNLAAIEAVAQGLSSVPQVACFDTSFHRTYSKVAELVPIPSKLCGDTVRRYGFHGLSYEYIATQLPEIAPKIANERVVVAHLGSGASLCAMRGGRSLDNTFGFTALDGLCMGTRPGALDAGVVLYLLQGLNLSAADLETVLYKKSGLLGISGISNDMRDLLASNQPAARLAVDYFVYRAVKEIGALTAVLGGLDALVFTAGIGERSPEIRRRICEAFAWLGVRLETPANASNATVISGTSSTVSVLVIPTNEELMIARHTGQLLGLV